MGQIGYQALDFYLQMIGVGAILGIVWSLFFNWSRF